MRATSTAIWCADAARRDRRCAAPHRRVPRRRPPTTPPRSTTHATSNSRCGGRPSRSSSASWPLSRPSTVPAPTHASAAAISPRSSRSYRSAVRPASATDAAFAAASRSSGSGSRTASAHETAARIHCSRGGERRGAEFVDRRRGVVEPSLASSAPATPSSSDRWWSGPPTRSATAASAIWPALTRSPSRQVIAPAIACGVAGQHRCGDVGARISARAA